jgi:hypothetical protein
MSVEMSVLISNVGGSGDHHAVSIKVSNLDWIKLSRAWGENGLQVTHISMDKPFLSYARKLSANSQQS